MFLIDTMVLSELRRRERDPGVVSIGEIERGIARKRATDPAFAAQLAGWLDQLSR